MATATASKPKAPRTIVTTKLVAGGGLRHTMTKTAETKLRDAYEIVQALRGVAQFQEASQKASEALAELIGGTP